MISNVANLGIELNLFALINLAIFLFIEKGLELVEMEYSKNDCCLEGFRDM